MSPPPGPQHVEAALTAGYAARRAMQDLRPFERAAALWHVAEALAGRREELARLICAEVAKPIRAARDEVARAVDTFEIAAELARRPPGRWETLELGVRSAGFEAIVRRFPLGLLSFITPFNFPLNLVAHKVAPAIAAGCPWVLKPAPQAPRSAAALGAILSDARLPPGAFAILPVSVEHAAPLVRDDRVALLSFTGSAAAGWRLKQAAGRKPVLLELGGNAACIVEADADLERAAARIAAGAFGYAGQSCISVQRVIVQRALYAPLLERLAVLAGGLRTGPPEEEATDLGPLIDEANARRVEEWVGEAIADGARVVCGGARDGPYYEATVLTDVPQAARVYREEVFGPVVCVEPYDDFATALERVNDSRYGLQAGLFTHDIRNVQQAYERLEVGAVLVNEVPTMRVDSMPYGGVKDSGLGREGVASAIAAYTTPRVLVTRRA